LYLRKKIKAFFFLSLYSASPGQPLKKINDLTGYHLHEIITVCRDSMIQIKFARMFYFIVARFPARLMLNQLKKKPGNTNSGLNDIRF
jgi:hypothetical protein